MSNFYCNCGGVDPAETILKLNDRTEKLEKALDMIKILSKEYDIYEIQKSILRQTIDEALEASE